MRTNGHTFRFRGLEYVRSNLSLTLVACILIGCNRSLPTPLQPMTVDEIGNVRPAKIIAQGQLLPAGGVTRLSGTPGDAVEAILVSVGQQVEPEQILIELRSASYRQAQLDTLREQLTEAQLQHDAAVDRAEIELSAARMQLSQAQEQIRSVQRRALSLPLLKRQWDDAQAALERAESMAQDPLTRALVSRLDIDKQRANVTASQLQYEQQREALAQAEESAEWAEKLAKEKLSGAEKSLELTRKADPANVIRSQIKGAEQQLASARVVSPIKGNVVALDARIGETVAQFPLVQVADLSRMVCQVEIYQTDAPLVRVGQTAELRSDAFEKPLRAKVVRIDRLIGYPQLRSTDPLAKVDYRTLPVLLEVAEEDAPQAARWLQLQVEVTIPLDDISNQSPEVDAPADGDVATDTEPVSQAASAPLEIESQTPPSESAKPNGSPVTEPQQTEQEAADAVDPAGAKGS